MAWCDYRISRKPLKSYLKSAKVATINISESQVSGKKGERVEDWFNIGTWSSAVQKKKQNLLWLVKITETFWDT